MLQAQPDSPSRQGSEAPVLGSSGMDLFDMDKILAMARRQWWVVAASVCVFVLAGAIYAFTAQAQYVASASILIDQNNSMVVDRFSELGGTLEDESAILSQVELLKSAKLARQVVDTLGLAADPSIASPPAPSFASRALGLVSALFQPAPPEEERVAMEDDALRSAAVRRLQSALSVERIGRSSVLRISFVSTDPLQAARIAQAYANAYVAEQLDSKFAAIRRASEWLENRIAELRERSIESDLAVQRFRGENNLISANGRLVTDQSLTELNSQLIIAQADTGRTQARYNRIRALLEGGDTSVVFSEALDSTVVNRLRERYLDTARREADISRRVGKDHVQAERLRTEMAEYEKLIREELLRIAESYQNEYQVAKAREDSLRQTVEQATGVSSDANKTLVQLRELEREAETYKNLYQTFLQRYQETVQQQSFPVTEARVISDVEVPTRPTYPRRSLVIFAAIVLGGAVGSAIAGYREFVDRYFRTGDQVRSSLGLDFLGFGPIVSESRTATARTVPETDHPRAIRKTSPVQDHVVRNPTSFFAETLRTAKVAADFALGDHNPKRIGIVSVLPGEGKTTVAINFAELLASQGGRTLLIDADLRNPGTTRAIARNSQAGLIEAIRGEKPIKDLILINPETNLAVLPSVVKHRVPHSSGLLGSKQMEKVLAQADEVFDYVVLDLPPLGPVVDVRAIAPMIDCFVFVVEWGRTARRTVRTTLATERLVAEKTLGVILNKADMSRLKFYQSFGSSEYYFGRYTSYYQRDY